MHKSATKCNETLGKRCKNEHGASKIIDTFETYHPVRADFEDYPAWHFDSKGAFSVKSAYKLFMNMQNKELSTSSGTNHENKFWKDLWDLPCLPKVKQFMWRLAHNSLPLRVNIEKRNIPCDTLCVCCKRLDEDGAHLFLKCKEAKEVWRMLNIGDI
jgi:hypothetical protein